MLILSSRQRALWTLAVFVCWTTAAAAQTTPPTPSGTPVIVSADSVLYADNNEFYAAYRTGETVLGSWVRFNTDIKLSPLASIRLGAYALARDGCDSFGQDNSPTTPCRHELFRPVASLMMGTDRHKFIIGTLDTGGRPLGMGPDRTTPHGLLPPLAVEQLWLDHGYEAGIQWLENTRFWKHDMWFDYRRVVTDEHREFFNSGFVGRVEKSPTTPLAFVYQFQVVHHGGQQFHNGVVSDSFGGGPGVMVRYIFPVIGLTSLEAYELISYDRPDREKEELTKSGNALFIRIAAENRGWRAHVIGWQGKDFKHEDGDANYLSYIPDLQQNVEGHRDYYELGLARLFRPAAAIDFEVAGRAHYVQDRWGYSYRMVGIVHLGIWRGTIR